MMYFMTSCSYDGVFGIRTDYLATINNLDYRVRVSIKNLNIRRGPGTHFAKTGAYTGVGVFTIVAESVGLGSEKG